MIANGYYPDSKEDTTFPKELNSYSRDVSGELAESSHFYKSIGNAADYYAVRRVITDGPNGPVETLKVNEKLFSVSEKLYNNAEMLGGLAEYVGKGLIIGGFGVGVYRDIKRGLPTGQAVYKNGLTTIYSIIAGKLTMFAIGAVATTISVPVVLSIGLLALGSYAGAKLGEVAYYSGLNSEKKDLNKETEKYCYDGFNFIPIPSKKTEYDY